MNAQLIKMKKKSGQLRRWIEEIFKNLSFDLGGVRKHSFKKNYCCIVL